MKMGEKRTVDALRNNANSPTREARLATAHPRLCTATKRGTGEPCARYAIRGGNVCGSHGGHTKHVRRKANERLEFAKDMMLGRAIMGIPEPEPPQQKPPKPKPKPNPKPKPATPAQPPPDTAATVPASSGEVMHITKEQHEAMKRGELPADDHAAVPPDSTRKRADRSIPPPWALPPPASPRGQLTTEEDAASAAAQANRAAGVSHTRRKRR